MPSPSKLSLKPPPPPLVSFTPPPLKNLSYRSPPHPSRLSRTTPRLKNLSHNPPPHLVFLTPDLDADLDAAITNLDAVAIVNLDPAPIDDLAAALLAVEELCCDYPRGGLVIVMVCGFCGF